MSKLTLEPIPRSFDVVTMLRNLYAFVQQLAELVELLQEELARLKAAGVAPQPPKGGSK